MLTRYSVLVALSFGILSPHAWAAAPSVSPLNDQKVVVGESLVLRISGFDPDGGVPGLYFLDMPYQSSFDDNGDGTRTFNWTPGIEDIGEHSFTVIATDAQADGSMSSNALFVNVIEFDDFDEPEIMDATDTALTSVGSNGDYNFDTISQNIYGSVSVTEDAEIDFAFGGSDDRVFFIDRDQLSIFTDFDSTSFSSSEEIPVPDSFPYTIVPKVSADGKRAATLYSGYHPVIIYENTDGLWAEQSQFEVPLTTDFQPRYNSLRYTTVLSMSGQTIITGHPAHDQLLDGTRLAGSGAVRVYDEVSASWSNTDIVKAPNPDEHDQFGSAVDIDGDIMVISAIAEGSAGRGNSADMLNNDFKADYPYSTHFPNSSGAVYVYERVLGSWVNTAYLKASDNVAKLQFGWKVAVDGEKIYVSATGRNIDTSPVHYDFRNELVDKNEGAVYVFEKNTDGDWEETHIIESFNIESKFGLYLSAENNALAVGSAEAASLFTNKNGEWKNVWVSQSGPLAIALGKDALAISTHDGLKVLTANEFVFTDADDDASTPLAAPTFFGTDFNDGVFSKTIQAGEEVAIVVGAWQIDHVPGLYLEYSPLGGTFDDNLDGTRTFRWQSSAVAEGIFSFDIVATNALDASVRNSATIEITIGE